MRNPGLAALWGLAKTARVEEAGLKITCIDVRSAEADLPRWFPKIRAVGEDDVAVRGQDAYAARLARTGEKALELAQRLRLGPRGALTSLELAPQTERRAPAAHEVEVRVRAIGLNFRDVLNVRDPLRLYSFPNG